MSTKELPTNIFVWNTRWSDFEDMPGGVKYIRFEDHMLAYKAAWECYADMELWRKKAEKLEAELAELRAQKGDG